MALFPFQEFSDYYTPWSSPSRGRDCSRKSWNFHIFIALIILLSYIKSKLKLPCTMRREGNLMRIKWGISVNVYFRRDLCPLLSSNKRISSNISDTVFRSSLLTCCASTKFSSRPFRNFNSQNSASYSSPMGSIDSRNYRILFLYNINHLDKFHQSRIKTTLWRVSEKSLTYI